MEGRCNSAVTDAIFKVGPYPLLSDGTTGCKTDITEYIGHEITAWLASVKQFSLLGHLSARPA